MNEQEIAEKWSEWGKMMNEVIRELPKPPSIEDIPKDEVPAAAITMLIVSLSVDQYAREFIKQSTTLAAVADMLKE